MLSVTANKINKGLITSAILLVILTLMWQHLNGGIVSHHLLHRADFPAVSNAWGIIIIPVLAWLTALRLQAQRALKKQHPWLFLLSFWSHSL